MSGDFGEAIGAILGLAFGGVILLRMAAELNNTGPVDIAAWGEIFIVGAVVATVLLGYGVVQSIASW